MPCCGIGRAGFFAKKREETIRAWRLVGVIVSIFASVSRTLWRESMAKKMNANIKTIASADCRDWFRFSGAADSGAVRACAEEEVAVYCNLEAPRDFATWLESPCKALVGRDDTVRQCAK